MTRRTLLVPLFAAAFILAPSEISGTIAAALAPDAPGLAVRPGSPAEAGSTGLCRWSVPSQKPLGLQGRSA
jgi:hypothetical protein